MPDVGYAEWLLFPFYSLLQPSVVFAAWIGPFITYNILNLSGAQAAGRQRRAGISTQIAHL